MPLRTLTGPGKGPGPVAEAPKDPHGARQGSGDRWPRPLRTLTGPGKGPGMVGGVKDVTGALNQGRNKERFRLGRVKLDVKG